MCPPLTGVNDCSILGGPSVVLFLFLDYEFANRIVWISTSGTQDEEAELDVAEKHLEEVKAEEEELMDEVTVSGEELL